MKVFKKYWIGICSSILIGITGFALNEDNSGCYVNSYEESLIIGKALGYAIVAFFCCNWIRKRWGRKKIEFLLFCFSVSFALCAMKGVVKLKKQLVQLDNSRREIAQLMRDHSNKDTSQASVDSCSYSVREHGDLSYVLSFMKQSLEFSNKMASEITEMGAELDDLLNFENFCNPGHFIRAKERVNSFLCKLEGYEQQYKHDLVDIEKKIKGINFESYDFKRAALTGFEMGRVKTENLMMEYFNIEKDFLHNIDELLSFFSLAQDRFWMSDDGLVFQNDIEAEIYNLSIQKQVKCGEREEEIIRQLEEHRRTVFQKMESINKA